ncbi:hypothetical protein BDN72DRAFT_835769 [Pluteus cervinus]|uniref:Uncharacterized protein n=1 Tax=Pluteus cervinus TaxID=181527 RepID=A0ACD3B4Z5_9AGAR|nr:hypothetical protein BDN72DRAFT_835769 [Pluteus cervinus]
MPRPPFISSTRPILFPSLERLHIDARGTISALRYVRDVCPSLTHLRMHICGGSFWNIGGRHSDPPYIRNMPKNLVMNYLDLILSPSESLDSLAFYLQLISGRLNLFGLLAKHATVAYPRDMDVDGVKADWMDRLAGGLGEWQGSQVEMPRT